MLNTVYFITENLEHFNNAFQDGATNNFHLSYLTDCYQANKLQETYIFFSENKTPNFSLSFKMSTTLSPYCVQSIISFLFIPGYGKTKKAINIICTNPPLFNEIAVQLKTAANLQGIDNLSVNLLTVAVMEKTALSDTSIPTHILFEHTKTMLHTYKNAIDNFLFTNKIFCLLDPISVPTELYNELNILDLKFKNTYPDVYKMVYSKLVLSEEIELLKLKNLYLQNELNNYVAHNNILRSNHVATELQHYYDHQYEVLPTWYKQVGHLLKVILGKRTLRSLFNKNIKKHQA